MEIGKSSPRISVVIPAYNEENFIGNTLENVKATVAEYVDSTGNEVEILVVDNNSSDRTGEIAEAQGARVIFEPKNQIAAARNAGGKAAQGEIVAFLDADDHMSSNLLCLVDKVMASDRYIGGGVRQKRERESLIIKIWHAYMSSILWFCGISAGLMYTHRDTFNKLGGFDEKLYAGEDAQFLLDLKRLGKKQGKSFCVIKEGYVIKSTRKFDHYGGIRVLGEWLSFILKPKKARAKDACTFWYSSEDRSKD